MKRALLALLLIGCAPSVEDVCEDLAEECEDVSRGACIEGGNEVLGRAVEAGCEDTFDDYLDCVADAECGWRGCDGTLELLEECVGTFPDTQ